MKNQVKISEFIIDGKPTDVNIIDKIEKYHRIPINKINETFVERIYPSQTSSFRTYQWEVSKGRSGASQHCFGQNKNLTVDANKLGATDWTCKHFSTFKEQLLQELINKTNYTRLCVYNSFIHGDYKVHPTRKRRLYTVDSKGNWIFKENI
tara:strand:+ start:739 stop:1191 length:453 start_codon:yes stop_codon:yes gene_type:complete